MKKLVFGLIIAAMFASCKKDVIGDGPITTQTRTVSGFTGIDLQMNGNVFYTNSPEWKVEVSAKASIHDILETKLDNGKLLIRYRNGRTYDADETIRIHVSGPSLNSFSLNTSGSIYINNVTASYVEASATGSGSIIASGGWVTSEKLKTDASGRIDFTAVSAKEATARSIGSGDIRVRVSDKLDATINGSGSIYFVGSPLISSHINGSGRLVRL